jgi:hypothetical protein
MREEVVLARTDQGDGLTRVMVEYVNMDEKGFLMGRLTKTKRIFLRDLRGSGKLIGVS